MMNTSKLRSIQKLKDNSYDEYEKPHVLSLAPIVLAHEVLQAEVS